MTHDQIFICSKSFKSFEMGPPPQQHLNIHLHPPVASVKPRALQLAVL
jgi:hypothetical protein